VIYQGLYQMLAANAAVTGQLPVPEPPNSGFAIYFGAAGKTPGQRFVVINVLNAPPAATTLDGSSALKAGELQLDSYAENQIAARKLSDAVRDTFKDYGGVLGDGTTIQFTEVTVDRDAGYEVGGTGYVYRTMVRMTAMYTEAQQ